MKLCRTCTHMCIVSLDDDKDGSVLMICDAVRTITGALQTCDTARDGLCGGEAELHEHGTPHDL